MLLIDDNQVSVDQFIARVEEISGKTINLRDIKKSMELEFNPSKQLFDAGTFRNTGVRQRRQKRSDDVLAHFTVFSDKENRSVSFRFTNRMPYLNDRNRKVYDPKAIDISGGITTFEPRELERMVYLYCHPHCFDSPFRQDGVPYKYSHVNVTAENRKSRIYIETVERALNHARTVHESEIKVFAKGLGIAIDDKNDDLDDIRAKVMKYAMDNSANYMEKASDSVVKYEGMIRDAIDMRVIVGKSTGGYWQWSFAKGRRKGEVITTIPESANKITELITFLKENIKDYYHDIVAVSDDNHSNISAKKFLENIELGRPETELKPYNPNLELDAVVDHTSATNYLAELHPEKGQPSPANAKKFLEEVLNGNITDGNVAEEAKKYIKKS